ncbi:MAG: dipeptide epimerase [Gammaproteobacteria bacterium]|nr:dipeptide epimerase [Gammaproteobacteria bacterium]
MSIRLSVHQEDWTFREPFGISGHVSTSEPGIVVELQDGDFVGRGEAWGIYYFDETPASMIEQVRQVTADVEGGANRMDLLELLPPGGTRCAIDSALWDLEAKKAGKRAWEQAELELKRIVTVFTIGLEKEPAEMARKAAAAAAQPILKVKLDADRPVQKIEAIRAVRPDAGIIIDVNEGWSFQQLVEVSPWLHKLGVTMIEQPLPRGADGELEGYQSPLPLCADESCVHGGEIGEVAGRYQMINIKLDKSGGLTHGLEMVHEARKRDLGLMVGCMCGTSLSMAPAYVIGLACDFHDLDGPLLFKHDRPHGMKYSNGVVSPPCPDLWG